jgi:hypothetical protein
MQIRIAICLGLPAMNCCKSVVHVKLLFLLLLVDQFGGGVGVGVRGVGKVSAQFLVHVKHDIRQRRIIISILP